MKGQTAKEKLSNYGVSKEEFNKFSRGSLTNLVKATKSTKNNKVRAKLQNTLNNIKEATVAAAQTQILLPSNPGFIELDGDNKHEKKKVFKLRQSDLKPFIDSNTARNQFNFNLPTFAPYFVNFTRNGRNLLMGGRRGHVATYDCLQMKIGTELQLQQEVLDVQYLQNETLFAVAQERNAYIYDANGVEIHCLKRHDHVVKLDYLPYHFLLCTLSSTGWIKYQDISIGEYVAGYNTAHGPANVLRQNPSNAIMNVGHSNGVVSMWSPNSGKALVSMFCHKGAITDLSVTRDGNYFSTTGTDGYLKIWDMRKLTHVHAYKLNQTATTMSVSDRNLLAIGMGRHVQILKDAFTMSPSDITYMNHEVTNETRSSGGSGRTSASASSLLSRIQISSLAFRPLEDFLCIGHTNGISSIVVPGSGEANYDSFEANPFINSTQRREGEVQNLLAKVNYELIGLDYLENAKNDKGGIGTVEKDHKTLQKEQQEVFYKANNNGEEDSESVKRKKEKNRMRGKNKISSKLRRKQKNVIDEQMVKLKEKQKEFKEKKDNNYKEVNNKSFGVLDRFVSKR